MRHVATTPPRKRGKTKTQRIMNHPRKRGKVTPRKRGTGQTNECPRKRGMGQTFESKPAEREKENFMPEPIKSGASKRELLIQAHIELLETTPEIRPRHRWGRFTEYATSVTRREAQNLLGAMLTPKVEVFDLVFGVDADDIDTVNFDIQYVQDGELQSALLPLVNPDSSLVNPDSLSLAVVHERIAEWFKSKGLFDKVSHLISIDTTLLGFAPRIANRAEEIEARLNELKPIINWAAIGKEVGIISPRFSRVFSKESPWRPEELDKIAAFLNSRGIIV